MILVRKSLSSRRRGATGAASGSWRHSYRRVSSSYLLRLRGRAAAPDGFSAALKRKDEAEVRRLRSILDARLEKWDRALANAYNDPAQRSLLKRV